MSAAVNECRIGELDSEFDDSQDLDFHAGGEWNDWCDEKFKITNPELSGP